MLPSSSLSGTDGGTLRSVKTAAATARGNGTPADRAEAVLAALDAELLEAAGEVDRTLIQLALDRSLRERLRAGASLARLAARFRAAPGSR